MPPTLWTLVLSARDVKSPNAQTALAQLCEIYWYPLYAFVRRQGFDHHQAEDLTQGFFQHLFERDWLGGVDQQKGRFRTFLLCALSNFVNNERAKGNALKRGGGIQQFVRWDAETGESRLNQEGALETDPALDFDRLWACALVEKGLAALKDEYSRCEKSELFAAFSPYMTRPIPPGFYSETAARLRTTEGALRIAMHRFLQQFGDLVRAAVAQTVADPQSVDEELRDVLKAWAAQ